MPWPIVLYESAEAARIAGGGSAQVGAMWPLTRDVDEWCQTFAEEVAPRYLREHRHLRAPLVVKLPDGSWFNIDTRAYSPDAGYHGDGWGCTGEAPNITLSPSINIVGRYHGWIQNGVITDDCEGRQFPHA